MDHSKRFGFWVPEATGIRLAEKLRSALAAGLAILSVGLISGHFIEAAAFKVLVASMGATAVILFAVPNSPMARPWAMVGGHLISGVIGVLCSQWVPHIWVAAALAVGLSILAMHLSRCLHPPGGASALIPVLGGAGVQALGFQFLLMPLALNVGAMLAAWLIFHRLRRAPAVSDDAHAKPDPPPLERLGIRTEDLHAALLEMKVFVDVSEDELSTIYNLAARRAYQREFGATTCGHIMTREVITVEFGEELESTWRVMQQQGLKAIPVVSRGRHVLGIITMTDFFRHARAHDLEALSGNIRRLIRRTNGVTSTKPEVAGQIMSRPVITARQDAPIADLAERLAGSGIHQIPIVDERDKLVGLVTQSDLIGAMHRLIGARTFADSTVSENEQPTPRTDDVKLRA